MVQRNDRGLGGEGDAKGCYGLGSRRRHAAGVVPSLVGGDGYFRAETGFLLGSGPDVTVSLCGRRRHGARLLRIVVDSILLTCR